MATTHNNSPPLAEATGDTNLEDAPAPPQTSRSTITLRQSIFPVSLVTILFFLWGFAYGLLDVLNAKFQTALNITAAKAGGLQASYFGAYLIAPLTFSGWIVRKFGYKWTFIAGLCIYGVGSLMFWPSAVYKSFPGFCGSLFIVGSGLSTLETSANPYIATCGPPRLSEFRLELSQSFQAIGSVVAPLLASKLFFKDANINDLGHVQWTYVGIAAFVFLLSVVFFFSHIPEITDEDMATQAQESANLTGYETATNSSPNDRRPWTSPTTVEQHPSPGASSSENGDGPEFIGHLNPEGIFVALARTGAPGASQLDDSLGHWFPRTADTGRLHDNQPTHKDLQSKSASAAKSFNETTLSREQSKQQWLDFLPDLESFVVLREIYLKEIHPLFPIFQPESIPITFARDELRCTDAIFMLSVCLSVASSPAARPHLPLQHQDGFWSPELFARRLSQTLVKAVETAGSVDKWRAVRVFTVLSLFSQLAADDHASAEYCARAVSYSQTLQLHLETAHVRKDDALAVRLFLCVWALDRLNAAFHSRPLLIHPRDIGRNMEATIAQQDAGFRVLLVVCGLLEEIIHLYRPFRETGKGKDDLLFPSFEELVVRADAVQCETHLLATVETLYHSVAMLSHRCNSLQHPDRSSVSYLRANLSVARLITIMRTNFGSSLSSFPFIPYALSLALRVSYRELRFSRIPLHRSMARDQLLGICGLLEPFVETYGFVRRLVALAVKTVEEMDRVAASVLQARHNGREGSAQARGPSQDGGIHSGSTNHSSAESRSGLPTNVHPQVSESHDAATAAVERFHALQIPRYDAAQYTAKSFDPVYQIPDMPDLFEHFDPGFNLDAVDFALVQNDGGLALPGSELGTEEGWIYGAEASDVLPNDADRCVSPSATTL